jgi:hypothetical protein
VVEVQVAQGHHVDVLGAEAVVRQRSGQAAADQRPAALVVGRAEARVDEHGGIAGHQEAAHRQRGPAIRPAQDVVAGGRVLRSADERRRDHHDTVGQGQHGPLPHPQHLAGRG